MLLAVGFRELLKWLTWYLFPILRFPSPVDGFELSNLDSVIRVDAAFSIILLGAAWGSDPGGISWEPGYSESHFQTSLGRGMLDY